MPKRARIATSNDAASTYRKTILPNGIRVVTEHIPHVKSISIGVWIDTGSRYEDRSVNGISHFVEHMVFKGTEHRTTQQIARSLESVGGYLNAFTTKEQTCYYARALDEHTEKAIDILSDLVQYPVFSQKEIEKEKKVVLEELKNIEDDPDDLIHDVFEKSIFAPSPLGLPVIGSAETIKAFSRNELFRFFGQQYCSNNMVIAAAGYLNHKEFVELISQYFRLDKGDLSPRQKESFVRPVRKREEIRRPIQQAHICTGTVAYSVHSAYRFPSLVLNTLLGDGMSSRLFQNIRERYGFAYSVYSFLNLLRDTGSFGVYIGTDTRHVKKSIDLIFVELSKLKKKPVSRSELNRTKAQLKGSMMLGLESTVNRMMRLGSGEIYFEEFMPLDEVLRKIDNVTSEALSEVAQDLLDEEHFSTVVFLPE